MRIHILGICGTFMGGIAALARELGVTVEGSDANVYPPMSDQLRALGIALEEGWSADHLRPAPDLVVVGNALSRGNPSVEYMLNAGLPYVSGPQWLGEHVLHGRPVLAVAGTHGKTTTTSLLAHLLDAAGLAPGFLIGGVPENFGVSARLGIEPLSLRERGRGEGSESASNHPWCGAPVRPSLAARSPQRGMPQASRERSGSPSSGAARHPLPQAGEGNNASPAATPFVLEADEYDTAFFDKRSKFVHYHPRIAILNNLEYDHADIFPDVAAIQRQFHHLVRTVPGNGRLLVNAEDPRLAEVLAMGCWTPVETFGMGTGDWRAQLLAADGSAFAVTHRGEKLGEIHWTLTGRHNVMNALAALAAANAAGVEPRSLLPAFATFTSVKRRMETLGEVGGVHVYDDFAHHPTAIATTLAGLRAKVGKARILVALEPRSNSMRAGAHLAALAPSLADADRVVLLQRPELPWDAHRVTNALQGRGATAPSVPDLVAALAAEARTGDHVVFMSNGGFENAPRRFLDALRTR
jgi:UDP-N-acetylmuramate: L-alanyl-gamma-D-glutamyl-meso-diaminopimelate ligase